MWGQYTATRTDNFFLTSPAKQCTEKVQHRVIALVAVMCKDSLAITYSAARKIRGTPQNGKKSTFTTLHTKTFTPF